MTDSKEIKGKLVDATLEAKTDTEFEVIDKRLTTLEKIGAMFPEAGSD